MNEQAIAWSREFGDSYHARNRVQWEDRIRFWNRIMVKTRARSIYEVGCGPGWNLTCLRHFRRQAIGCDVNPIAVKQARAAGLDVYQGDALEALTVHGMQPTFDLMMTVGCLIHIPPQTLPAVMQAIVATSAQYVLAVEYEGDEMIEYRGEQDRLWKRDYGAMYRDLGLRLVDTGPVGPMDGFDHCTWWLMERA